MILFFIVVGGIFFIFMISAIVSKLVQNSKVLPVDNHRLFTGKLANTDLSINEAVDYLRTTDSFVGLVLVKSQE